jgi:ABC-2 type transport system permease protein
VAEYAPRGNLAVYRALVRARIRSYAAYRTSFLIDVSTNALIPLMDLAVVIAIFRVTPSLGGFGADEVLLMFGISTLSFALADLLVGEIEKIRNYVRLGTMDAVLVRPLSVLGQLLTADFALRRIGRVVVTLVVFGVALARADLDLTPARVVLLVVAPLAGATLFASIFVASATVAFWWIESGEFANGLTYGGRDFTSYPVNVYGRAFRHVFAYGVGFAFVSYYPALALLGRSDPLGLPAWVAWCSPVVAVLAAVVASLVWRFGVRHYRSTGS